MNSVSDNKLVKKDAFNVHFKRTREIINSWPSWKREILIGSGSTVFNLSEIDNNNQQIVERAGA